VARPDLRLPANAPGDFFVDSTCIDCATCRQMAPEVFAPGDGFSYVARQPGDPAADSRALKALVACPTGSIGAANRAAETREAANAFPEPQGDGVFFCGYTSEKSFGAWSWLAARPDGNVLVDSPRAAAPLLSGLERLGGVATLFLTHRDDVADHARWSEALGCERVLHARDLTGATSGAERRLEGDAPVRLAEDLLAVPVPGHTAGSAALLWRDRFLFTGDHLWGDEEGRLGAGRDVCWHSWAEQVRSVALLENYSFEWVLPGHGERARFSAAEMRRQMRRLVQAVA
jgi:glyoxylase-like metal-dependent hydrolase (beta-lactamase superfamily II)/ferredoxin